jgi:hypothetical protein
MKKFPIVLAFAIAGIVLGGRGMAEEQPPGLTFSGVLNAVKLSPADGQFRIEKIQALSLPEAKGTTSSPYAPDGGGKLWTILKKADGTELYRFDWYAEKLEPPLWLLGTYKAKDLRTGKDAGGGQVPLTEPGNYVLEFCLESGKFYTFPFAVSKTDAGYFLDGDWENWGYLLYAGANPEEGLQFKIWLRNKAVGEKTVRTKIEIKDAAGKLLCTSRPDTSQTLTPEWNRFAFDLISPMEGTSGGAYFKAKDLLANDGNYVLRLEMDGQLYGEWPFSVADHKLNYVGRTVRGSDPLTFIDGGKDAWWYEKKKP